MVEMLHEDVDKGRNASIGNMDNMIQQVADVLRLLAHMAAARPEFFRTEQSRDVLYRVVTSSPEILCQQLEHHAAYTMAIAQGQPVRIKPPKSPPPADGRPRGRGRPPGTQNHLTVFASPAEIERLRALAAWPPP
ncbi:MAG TPA: hypothetical protein VGJ20_21580 [Xanthobacteraceae bacterium]|jgi:hypothetical protein